MRISRVSSFLTFAVVIFIAAGYGQNLPLEKKSDMGQSREVAVLAGGCFWCLEAVFDSLLGVEQVESGYSGGDVASPSYRDVCSGATGHAEAIRITFDPKIISYKDLLNIFFAMHDPTTLNRQGPDEGTQYRSAIFFLNERQKAEAEEVIKSITVQKLYDQVIVTEMTPFKEFYKAEDYHQDYFKLNGNQPYCRFVISPKMQKFRDHFKDKIKKDQP